MEPLGSRLFRRAHLSPSPHLANLSRLPLIFTFIIKNWFATSELMRWQKSEGFLDWIQHALAPWPPLALNSPKCSFVLYRTLGIPAPTPPHPYMLEKKDYCWWNFASCCLFNISRKWLATFHTDGAETIIHSDIEAAGLASLGCRVSHDRWI